MERKIVDCGNGLSVGSEGYNALNMEASMRALLSEKAYSTVYENMPNRPDCNSFSDDYIREAIAALHNAPERANQRSTDRPYRY